MMNGAQSLIKAAVASGIEYCFANPGTTEIPLVAAMDSVPTIKPILSLFEGVCTGAADGYGRIAGRPAMTLTHLGPGFANGIANLHNARRAHTPIVNVIGDHASWHLPYDPPLASDIKALACSVSAWVKSSASADQIAGDFFAAVTAAWQPAGQIASLLLPMDFQVQPVTEIKPSTVQAPKRTFKQQRVEHIAKEVQSGKKVIFLVGDSGLSECGLTTIGRLVQLEGVSFLAETYPRLSYRGGGLANLDRLPYFPEKAIEVLQPYDLVVCVGTTEPISYFGYEGLPSKLVEDERLFVMAEVGDDVKGALSALAEGLNAPAANLVSATSLKLPAESELLTPQSIADIVSFHLPHNSIVSIEGGTCGYPFFTASTHAAMHRVMTNTGGAIGQGIPVAIGAALAEPDTPVFCLQSDGSAQYTIQALWTIAREQLPIIILIAANHRYAILQNELKRAGVTAFGDNAKALTLLDKPKIDWQALSNAYGVPSYRVASNGALSTALKKACELKQPLLIEMVL